MLLILRLTNGVLINQANDLVDMVNEKNKREK